MIIHTIIWSRRKYVVSCAVALSSLLGVVELKAQSGVDPSAVARKTQARQFFDEGVSLLRQELYVDAANKFRKSYELKPSGGTLLNLGIAHKLAGHRMEAYLALWDAIYFAIDDKNAQREAAAREAVREIDSGFPQLVLAIAPETSALRDAHISINGIAVRGPLAADGIPIDHGKYAISVAASNYQTFQTTVSVEATARAVLVTIPELKSAQTEVTTPPKLELGAQTTPLAPSIPSPNRALSPSIPIPVGPPPVHIRNREGSGDTVTPDTPDSWTTPRSVGIIVGGLGVVGVVAGAAMLAYSNDMEELAANNCPNGFCNILGSNSRNDATLYARGSAASLGLGGLLAVTGVGIVLASSNYKPQPTLGRFTPRGTSAPLDITYVGVRTDGLWIQGRF